MYTLAIDTSADFASVALGLPGRIVCSATLIERRSAEGLIREIYRLKESFPGEYEQISQVAVCLGPGSYTGIRIGIATAQAIALGKGIPVVGVSSMLAAVSEGSSGVVEVELPARVGEVFRQRFEVGADAVKPLGELEICVGESKETAPLAAGCISAMAFKSSPGHLFLQSALEPLAPVYGKPLSARTLRERGIG